ncbi:hypothetical protein MMSR116_30155 [Methylobacterium mesophilicum SR1.6/6]|uniref:Uncharacterized protein n=1 Tax=Methylobacterium mesophilicum SR1.6/6 TaxID=908290 RepID=A0A6B9FVL0_9HYPH|nr:hypothetical protein [Methylobacterium mesophilicum]QGY05686.1 hypothetical protein MMSR116_30155 [Methylobacterium mesophilicum SR1.6/6]
MTHRIRAGLALACAALAFAALLPPAQAGDASAAAVSVPWGDWLVALLQPVSAVLVPIAAAAVTAGVARVAPWAASVLTRDRVEAAIRAGAAYGQNAVAGAAKGRTVSVDLGAAVVAAGARHVLATAPARVVRRAGGPEGVAARIFRALPLDPQASAANVLAPALTQLQVAPTRKTAARRG